MSVHSTYICNKCEYATGVYCTFENKYSIASCAGCFEKVKILNHREDEGVACSHCKHTLFLGVDEFHCPDCDGMLEEDKNSTVWILDRKLRDNQKNKGAILDVGFDPPREIDAQMITLGVSDSMKEDIINSRRENKERAIRDYELSSPWFIRTFTTVFRAIHDFISRKS